jgi:LacI family transcriptional regulator
MEDDRLLLKRREEKSMARPTIADVAKLAGVSTQTVSNFLTGRNSPHPANRAKLEEAIKALNYVPSAAARALRSQRSNFITLLLEDGADSGIDALGAGFREPLHALYLHGAAMRARELGFYVTTVLTWRGETETHAKQLAREGRTDGVICSSELVSSERAKELTRLAGSERLPIVMLQERKPAPGIHSITAKDEDGIVRIVRHLREFGHSHVAIVTVNPLWPGPVRRAEAFFKEVKAAGMHAEEWNCSAYTIDSVRTRVVPELHRSNRPSAIVAVNDTIAMALIQQCLELGIAVPHECSIVGFGDLEIARHFRPSITTVRIPAVEMGACAVDLIAKISSGEPYDGPTALDIEFLPRGSTGPVSQVAKKLARRR